MVVFALKIRIDEVSVERLQGLESGDEQSHLFFGTSRTCFREAKGPRL